MPDVFWKEDFTFAELILLFSTFPPLWTRTCSHNWKKNYIVVFSAHVFFAKYDWDWLSGFVEKELKNVVKVILNLLILLSLIAECMVC